MPRPGRRTLRLRPSAAVAATIILLATACSRGGAPPVVAERFASAATPADNIDSIAFWSPGPWLLATGKESHALLVYDAATGALLRRVGGAGTEPGRFLRPNGIAVAGDLLLVVERDNHRVQALALPSFEPLGIVGADVLRSPYGIAVADASDGALDVFVTDSWLGPDGGLPPAAELGDRVKRFRLTVDEVGVRGTLEDAFGDTGGDGVLGIVESIAVDQAAGTVLVADEGERVIKVYRSDGTFTGTVVGRGLFQGDPEGIALYACGDDGVWVAADQLEERTVFHLFDRRSMRLLGSFRGAATANTDGLAVTAAAVAAMPAGAVFAVHDDAGVTALAWDDVRAAVSGVCGRT